MKKLLLVVLFLFFLVSCSSSTSKPSDVSQKIWDDGIQLSIAINEAVQDIEVPPDGVGEFIASMVTQEDLSEIEKDIGDNLFELNINGLRYNLARLEGTDVEEAKSNYDESYNKILEIFGESNLSSKNKDSGFINDLADAVTKAEIENSERNDKLKQDFISSSNIIITADEVRYNMSNNLDKQFYLEGTVELCDYYNYGFTNESKYFCGQLTPFEGGFTDSWYLYFDRESFDGVFNVLLQGNLHLRIAAEVPSSVYKRGQGLMAWVRKTGEY